MSKDHRITEMKQDNPIADTVLVRVTAFATVIFDDTCVWDNKDWEDFKSMPREDAAKVIADMIADGELTFSVNDEDIEVDPEAFEAETVDAAENPTVPEDSYSDGGEEQEKV